MSRADRRAGVVDDGLVSPRAEQPKRRTFTAEYKLAMVAEYDAVTEPGAKGADGALDGAADGAADEVAEPCSPVGSARMVKTVVPFPRADSRYTASAREWMLTTAYL